MTDPTIVCPHCRKEIKLNESLAAPLLESTRREFESKLAAAEAAVTARAAELKSREEQLSAAKLAVEEEVRTKTAAERAKIAAEEARKAKLAAAVDLDQKNRELSELNELLQSRDQKLGELQAAQAELIRAKRQLDDQKREMELTVETRVQQSLDAELQKARSEAEQKLAAVVAEKEKADAAMRLQLVEIARRESAVEAAKTAAEKEQEAARRQMAEQLEKDRARIVAEESEKIAVAMSGRVAEMQKTLAEQETKLAEAQRAQAESLRKQRELDEARRELELTIEKRVGENLSAVSEKARRDVEDAIGLKLAEKDLAIQTMQRQIEELKRTSEQGSQQAQGEVLELLLEQQLGARFPHDRMEPVAKGEHGGDLLHRVHLPTGSRCGSILWETKRTKHWSDGWLSKLREDQQAAKAEVAVIVSFALPKGVEVFDQMEGIWVIHPRSVLPMATVLRDAIVAVHNTRQSGLGQVTKMEQIYAYLTGPQFRLRMEAIIESYDEMREELAKERKAIMKQWQKRETQIERLLAAATGMYGEVQGIAGAGLPELKGMALLEIGDQK